MAKKLSDSSRIRLANQINRVHKSGYTVQEALNMTDKELRQNLGLKGKKASLDAFRRNLRSATLDDQRKREVVNEALKWYQKHGWTGRGLKKKKVDLWRHVETNTFWNVVEGVKDYYGMSTDDAIDYAHDIIEQARVDFDSLAPEDQDILDDAS